MPFKSAAQRRKFAQLLVDGKISPETAAEAAKVLGVKMYAIGAGTNGIAPYPFIDPFGRTVYQNIKVEFNEAGLKKVAEIGAGQFYRATDTRSLEQIYGQIDKLEKSTVEMTQYKQYRDLFPWCLTAGFGLLIFEIAMGETAWRKLP